MAWLKTRWAAAPKSWPALWAWVKAHKREIAIALLINEIRGWVTVSLYLSATGGRLLP